MRYVCALLMLACAANFADAQLFGRRGGDRVNVRVRARFGARDRFCPGGFCYQPIQPLFVQPAFAPSWSFPRRDRQDFDLQLRFRSSRGDFCPWCR